MVLPCSHYPRTKSAAPGGIRRRKPTYVLQCGDDSGNFLCSDFTTYTVVLRSCGAVDSSHWVVTVSKNGNTFSPESPAMCYRLILQCRVHGWVQTSFSLQNLSSTPGYAAEYHVLIRRTPRSYPQQVFCLWNGGTFYATNPPHSPDMPPPGKWHEAQRDIQFDSSAHARLTEGET